LPPNWVGTEKLALGEAQTQAQKLFFPRAMTIIETQLKRSLNPQAYLAMFLDPSTITRSTGLDECCLGTGATSGSEDSQAA